MPIDQEHPVYGPFFGVMGAASAIVFSGEWKFADLLIGFEELQLELVT